MNLKKGGFEMDPKERILQIYKKVCKNCECIGLVPNKHNTCLKCLREKLKLYEWEDICLQCGEKKEHLPRRHKICLDCLEKNLALSKEELTKVLNDEQKVYLKEYLMWKETRTSFIILMS